MRTFFERFLSGLVLMLALALLPQGAAAEENIRIVVYGDSLTSGYQLQPEQAFPARLERKLKEIGFTNFEVVNMSVAGETTSGGAGERLGSLLDKRPDIVVVELGTNDAIRGVTATLIYNNVATIVSKLAASRTYIVLMGTTAPPGAEYGYSDQIEEGYRRIAQTYNVAFYPLALDGIAGNPDLTLADGLHPNAKGVDVMVEGVYRMVDAGMRWRLEVLQYQQQYKQQQRNTPRLVAP